MAAYGSPATIDTYDRWGKKFEERFGEELVDDLQPRDIKAWLGELQKKVSARSAGNALRCVSPMFKWAMDPEQALISRDPTRGVRVPKSDSKEPPVLDDDQMRRFLAFVERDPAGRRDYAMIRLIVFTWIRLGEACGLRLQDLDLRNLDKAKITIAQTRSNVAGKTVTGKPKTPEAKATLAIDRKTGEVLRDHLDIRDLEKRAAKQWTETGLVFVNNIGAASSHRRSGADSQTSFAAAATCRRSHLTPCATPVPPRR